MVFAKSGARSASVVSLGYSWAVGFRLVINL